MAMFITRKIGKLLRGNATPMQLSMACVLGSLIGFMPGFSQAPGLLIVFIILLAILNANLFLAAVVMAVAKLISLAIMPLTFMVGRLLLDGPTGGLFAMLINAPVTALMGFEYYATTGGLVMGTLFGIIAAMLVIRALQRFRTKMASMEHGSERYQNWSSKGWVKVLTFVFIGSTKKRDYEKLLSRKYGNPVRILGVVGAVLLVVLLVLLYQFASGPIVAAAMQRGMERANGATVDIREVELDIAAGRLTLLGFAMADPNDLPTDLLRADRLEADVDLRDLLRKRLALDQARLTNASTGETRVVPGRRVGRWPEPKLPDRTPEEGTIEQYIEQAKVWKDRLSQLRQWMETLSGPEEAAEDDPTERRETLRERLERQIAERGYANVRAEHLITGAPTFMVYHLDAEQVRSVHLGGMTLDIRGRNLSTHPHLAEGAPSVLIESDDDRLRAFVSLDHIVTADVDSTMSFHLKNLDVDRVAPQLAASRFIQGGTMDLEASGSYGAAGVGLIDLPLTVTLHNTEMTLAGSSRSLSRLMVPIGLRGPLDNPAIMVDYSKLAEELIQAGASEFAEQLDDRIGDRLDDIGDRLPGGIGDNIRDGAGGLLPGLRRE